MLRNLLIVHMHAGITCTALPDFINGTIDYSSGTAALYVYGITATYQCNHGHRLASGDSVRTCTGDGSTPSGQWNGAAPQCPRMFILYLVVPHDSVHTQLWTVELLRLLPMDLLGYQQPQHSQGQ